MKFSHSIQFNAVPDWSSHYIAYSNLKKLIYQLEKDAGRPDTRASQDAESSPLLQGATDKPDKIFVDALDQELDKICSFFQLKELEIHGEADAFLKDEQAFEEDYEGSASADSPITARSSRRPRSNSLFQSFTGFARRKRTDTIGSSRLERTSEEDRSSDDEDDADERAPMTRSQTTTGNPIVERRSDDAAMQDSYARRRESFAAFEDYPDMAFSALYESGITLKKRAISLYVSLCELRSFIQLNQTGFRKVLKKYDKILDRHLKDRYMADRVNSAQPFQKSTMERLTNYINELESGYAKLVTNGDTAVARQELRLHLREHVVWERNTVWREMIGIERKAQAANIANRRPMLGSETDPRKQGDEAKMAGLKEFQTPLGRYRLPHWITSSSFFLIAIITATFAVLLSVPIMEKPEQQNCLALIVFVSLLWATEAIPLFVTSLLVPFLAVVLRVVRDEEKPHSRLSSKGATNFIFAAMWTPVIMLLLGGFTIAAALSKYNIAKMMATFVLSKAGTRPRTVILTNMFVATFLSMWISNVAAPVLCISIISPILRNLPADSNMSKALLLGIALASNIGGMASPIASPQNLIALQNMEPEPNWGTWFFVALPVSIISIVLIWVMLLITLQPGRGTTIVPIRPMKDSFTGIQWFISFVTLATIVLWCLSHQLQPIFGDMGVIAIIPLVLFFGTGILTKEDFNNFLWTIIILAAGGLALGKAVSSSGLLATIAENITREVGSFSLYGMMVTFAALILVVATFISHTVAALIVLPLVREVGEGMAEPHPNLLVMGSVLMASAAMGLPTSGFPNMTAIMMEDSQTGQRYLNVRHFITRGVPASMLTFVVVITVGYGLMLAAGL